MSDDLPPPLVPAHVDLTDFNYMPLDVRRLRDSRIAVTASGDEFRAAVLLWCASWHQKPAASLPDDDIELAQLAGFGRIIREWQKVRVGALHGWVKCSDGRWYHPVIAEKANEGWVTKQDHAWSRECDRVRKENKRRAEIGENPLPLPPRPPRNSKGPLQGIPPDVPGNSTGRPPEISRNSGGIPPEIALKVSKGKVRERERESAPDGAPPPDPDLRLTEAEPGPDETRRAFDAWNRMALDVGLAQAASLTPQRRSSIRARLRDGGGLAGWERALERVRESAFLRGETGRDGWRGADLDFVLRPGHFTKILEGSYADKAPPGTRSAMPTPLPLAEGISRITDDQWRFFVRRFLNEFRAWPPDIGPNPDQPGCLCPAHVLAAAGLRPKLREVVGAAGGAP